MPEPKGTGIWGFELDLGGNEADGFFKEVQGLASQLNTTTDHYEDENGKPVEFSIPQAGSTSWDPITLVRLIDAGDKIEQWFKDTEEKGHEETKKDLIFTLKDNAGNPVKTFNVVGAYPQKIDLGGLSASGGGVAWETITLQHEGIHLA
jgi:phage tail-like protein